MMILFNPLLLDTVECIIKGAVALGVAEKPRCLARWSMACIWVCISARGGANELLAPRRRLRHSVPDLRAGIAQSQRCPRTLLRLHMATLFSVSIMGEGSILTEALSIALRTRGLLATVVAESCEASPLPKF